MPRDYFSHLDFGVRRAADHPVNVGSGAPSSRGFSFPHLSCIRGGRWSRAPARCYEGTMQHIYHRPQAGG
ncbi:hypothetical protein M405DRAFT_807001 [Rhizopogon salebrosus TDB-379]|nr:hypothetical protein M405DRAFT_807001 [Rhizopogon salebrosus TDB-379]